MVIYEKIKPFLKKVPTVIDVIDNIQRYDLDNIYPQRCEETASNSYTLDSALKRLADFINGEGFQDEYIGMMIVNEDGQSLNDLLAACSRQFAEWDSIALHIGYNLNNTISSIRLVEYSYCRMGPKNKYGLPDIIRYSTNWERDSRKENEYRSIIDYPVFNPDPLVVQEQIQAAGGIDKYKGQIFYRTPKKGVYPKASYHAVLNQAQAQVELSEFKVSNVQNNFMATLAVVYPGEFESEEERQKFEELIRNKSGARNAGGRIGIQDKTGTKKAGDIFQTLSPANMDKLYEYTEKSCMEAIMEVYGMPKEILGVRPETGMFNQENMEQAYTYFNSITRNRRVALSRVFSEVLKYWSAPISSTCDIKPQKYILEGTGSFDINDNLKNMSGRESQNFTRILRKYSNKQYNRETATTLLRNGFGLSDDEINKLLDGIDADNEAPTQEQLAKLAVLYL